MVTNRTKLETVSPAAGSRASQGAWSVAVSPSLTGGRAGGFCNSTGLVVHVPLGDLTVTTRPSASSCALAAAQVAPLATLGIARGCGPTLTASVAALPLGTLVPATGA